MNFILVREGEDFAALDCRGRSEKPSSSTLMIRHSPGTDRIFGFSPGAWQGAFPMKSIFIVVILMLLSAPLIAEDYTHAAYIDTDAGICYVWNGDFDAMVAVEQSRLVATQDTTTGDMTLECSGIVDPPSSGKTGVLEGFDCTWTSPFWGPMLTIDTHQVVLKSGATKMKCHFQLPEPACQNDLGLICPPVVTDGLYVWMNGGFNNFEPPCPAVGSATWDWGDGTVEQFFQMPDGYVYPFPSDHTYAAPGSYNVDVRIFDEDGMLLDQSDCLVTVP
jgi:hypothetical protein